MNQQNIRIFMAVVENGSIAEAARVLHYTHPRVSESIRQLESKLGVQLLLRGRGIRKVELTPEGQRFIPVAMQWVMADQQIRQYIQDEKEPTFRLNASSTELQYSVPPIVRRMMKEIPELRVRLLSITKEKVMESLDRQEFDAAFWTGNPFEDSRMVWVPFHQQEQCVLCPADTTLPDRVLKTSELDPHYEVRYSKISPTDPIDPTKWRRENFPIRMEPRVRVANLMAVCDYLDDRRCWSIVPLSVAKWSMERHPGELTIRYLESSPPVRCCWILTRKSYRDTPTFQCFLRCCDAYLDATPYLQKTLVL